jgi:hypothetical protein
MEGVIIRDQALSAILRSLKQKYPELDSCSLSIGYGPTRHQLGEVNISINRSFLQTSSSRTCETIRKSADIIIDNSHYHLSNDAKLAVVAHELSHLVALDGGIPNDEASITRDSVRRVGVNPWKQLLADMCGTPCWHRERWIGGRSFKHFVRIIGGIPCVDSRRGLVLCPFLEARDVFG